MTPRNVVVGAVAGSAAGVASWLLSVASGEPIIAVISLLAVALVGLTLGAAAAVWAYAVAGVALVAQAILTPDRLISPADVVRIASFILGAPLIVLLSLRVERERRASRLSRDLSAASERLAVTERAAADAARHEVQEVLALVERERTRLEEVAEAIPEPLIVYDADSRGTYANRAAMRTFGRSFYDRPLEEWGRIANPRDERGAPLGFEEWPQVHARQQVYRRRMLVHLPMSGRDLLVDVEGTPVPDGGCVLLLRDVGQEVDERRRLSRFASFVAHELRNPLAVAKARMELAGREASVPPRAVDHNQRAHESVDAAIAILERLELFSRAEAGRLEATSEEFHIADAVRSAVERLRARGSDRPVEVAQTGPPTILGDRHLTEQALTNLLTNADRYSDPGGPVWVEIDTASVPEVRVRDGGPGIADEVAEQLFRDRVSSGRGLGLGLYLVRAAMEAQGGGALLEQRRPGAVFLLHWPRRAAPSAGAVADGERVSAGPDS